PSVLCLAPFSSREAALLKSRAYKRTRIDKEKKNKKTKGALRPLITGEGRLGLSAGADRHKSLNFTALVANVNVKV
ncbi:MAG: hypothetical protein ACI4XK_05915, partial [Bacilli bacterium]